MKKPNHLSILLAGLITFVTCINITEAQGYSPADSLDATHYEIRILGIDFPAQTINGSTTVWLTPENSPVPVIHLQLIELTATAVWVDGNPFPDFSQTDSLVSLPLSVPLQPGDTVAVRIDYNGIPFHESWGGFHFSGEYAFNLGVGLNAIPHNLGKSWYPCVDNFTDRATYDVYCTLPAGKMAVCGGMLVEQIDNGNGTITWHWNLPQEVPTYLSSLAAGNYKVVSDTFAGMNGNIPIDIYVRPQDTNKVDGTYVNLKEILGIYEECMGPYSWERVGYTGTAIGAMEHATNIFVPHNTISGNTSSEALMAHELAHMWMGDKVTCSSAEEMWINEGWATFFGMYYALPLYGDMESYKTEMRSKHAGVLQFCHTNSGDGSYFPLNQIPQEYTYGMSAYDRGSTVCQALLYYLGDSLFFETLAAFIDEFAFSDASSHDMRDFMTEYTGTDMSGFFDNFVLNSGTPHYSLDSFTVMRNGTDNFDVTVYLKQKRKGPAFTGNGNKVEVMFMGGNWNQFTGTLNFDGASGTGTIPVPFWPDVVLLDPEEQMCDATTDNYKVIRAPGTYSFDKTFFSLEVESAGDSAFLQVTHNWAPPDSLKVPVPGLRISDYRYWRVDGIVPAGFEATGKFFYTTNGYLDNTLITSSSDTVIILYRKDAGEEWQEVSFEKIGPWNVGNILVHNMLMGEYTLAVKESTVGTSGYLAPERDILKIFPNPSSDGFTIRIDSERNGELRIYSETGQVVKSFLTVGGRGFVTWEPKGAAGGIYQVALYREGYSEPEVRRAVYLP
jgi:aminopeptidase N